MLVAADRAFGGGVGRLVVNCAVAEQVVVDVAEEGGERRWGDG